MKNEHRLTDTWTSNNTPIYHKSQESTVHLYSGSITRNKVKVKMYLTSYRQYSNKPKPKYKQNKLYRKTREQSYYNSIIGQLTKR